MTTLYTVLILRAGRTPLIPFRRLRGSVVDSILGGLVILGAGITALVSAIRCRHHRWELIAISLRKMVLSVCMGSMTIQAASIARSVDDRHFGKLARSLSVYSVGLIAGLAGLCSIAFTDDSQIPLWIHPGQAGAVGLCVVMLAFPIVLGLFSLLIICFCGGARWSAMLKWFSAGLINDPSLYKAPLLRWLMRIVLWFVFTWGLGAVILGSWILAVLAENIVGVPSTASKCNTTDS